MSDQSDQPDQPSSAVSTAVPRLQKPFSLTSELACQAVKKAVRFLQYLNHNAVVRLHFIPAGQPSTAALHPFFRLINPPAVRGMACQAVKKAVRKSDGLLKAGGAEETRTLDPHTASVML